MRERLFGMRRRGKKIFLCGMVFSFCYVLMFFVVGGAVQVSFNMFNYCHIGFCIRTQDHITCMATIPTFFNFQL